MSDDGKVFRQDPPSLTPLIGSVLPYTAFGVFLNDLWFRYQYRSEASEAHLNQSIIKVWNEELEKSKIKLIVLLLDMQASRIEEIKSFLNNEHIFFLDLNFSDIGEEHYRIAGDGHPSAQLYTRWAEYLAKNWDW